MKTYFDAVVSLVGIGISGPENGPIEKYDFYDNSNEKPSEEAIQAKLKELEKQFTNNEYQRKRLQEYPDLQECIHAILDDDLTTLQAKRKLVKDKYPKP